MNKKNVDRRKQIRTEIIIPDTVERKIYVIRGQKVMISPDLAKLYGVEPRILIQAIKRKIERFPDDFMFQLVHDEYKNLKSQIVISSWGGARRALPYAFTEQGIAMLSSVLNSERAITINIAIMRAFVRLRHLIDSNKEFAQKISQLERKYEQHDYKIQKIFDQIRALPKLEENHPRVRGFEK